MGGTCSGYRRGDAYAAFWWGKLSIKDHLKRPEVYGSILLKWIFREWNFGVWSGSNWLWIETGDGQL